MHYTSELVAIALAALEGVLVDHAARIKRRTNIPSPLRKALGVISL
jgi:hypothetical protein